MATKSILKNVTLKEQKLRCQFVNALENSERKHQKTVVFSRTVSELPSDKMKEFFEDK